MLSLSVTVITREDPVTGPPVWARDLICGNCADAVADRGLCVSGFCYGVIVDVIRLSLTGTNRNGTWLRVRHLGSFAGEVRRWDLDRLGIDLSDLRAGLVPGCREGRRYH